MVVGGITQEPLTTHNRYTSSFLNAPRLARWIVSIVLACLCLVALMTVLASHPGAASAVTAGVLLMALLALQLLYFERRVGRPRNRQDYVALCCLACLTYLPMIEFGQAWVGMPGFLGGSALLVLPTAISSALFVAVVASMAVAQEIFSGSAYDIIYTSVSTVITGLVVYGLSRLAHLVAEVHSNQTKLAELAVTEERLRFARDLHDLLGYSLSTITLRSQLAHRLVLENPHRAQAEFAEVLNISRQALADVRAVARGYRELPLDDESRAAESILVAAGVRANVELDYQDLQVNVRTMLATVLREAVTNVLRHSVAENCDITVRQTDRTVIMEIVNDGVLFDGPGSSGATSTVGSRGGTGLDNMSARVAAMGGNLEAKRSTGGKFRVRVWLPLREEGAGDQPAA